MQDELRECKQKFDDKEKQRRGGTKMVTVSREQEKMEKKIQSMKKTIQKQEMSFDAIQNRLKKHVQLEKSK